MAPMSRFLLGLFVAAAWAPLLTLFAWPGGAVIIAAFTFPITFLVGFPLAFALRNRLNPLLCIVAGALLGGLGVLGYLAMTTPIAARNGTITLVAIGAISGGLFWVVGVRGNSFAPAAKIDSGQPNKSFARTRGG
jgi:hypothetical protein